MQSAIFDTPVIKIESLKTKFDTLVLSGSFINLIGDYAEAHFLHQLHFWSLSEYGVVIDDTRWIYKPLREWLSEVFTFLTEWKLRKAIASLLEKGLIERKKLYVKHHEIKHNNPYWNPKNQTYYYSVKYDKLQELIDEVENQENAGSTENVRIENYTELSSEDFQDTKCCELSQDKTENTSIENISKDKSHPTLPCECEISGKNDREKEFNNSQVASSTTPDETSVSSTNKTIAKDISSAANQNNCSTNNDVDKPKPKPKITKETKPKRQRQAPWKDESQFKQFYRALIEALPIVANSHTPHGLAQTIIRQLRSGIPHSYWDDFIAGLPIGTSTKPEWEIEPGVPYPMFVEYLTEKIKKGDNSTTNEQTRNEVFQILSKPRQAKAFWGQFKRSVVNVSEQIRRDRALGVSNPHTPVWTKERIEPSIEEAATAGEKIMAVNGAARTAIAEAKPPQIEAEEPLPDDPWQEEASQLSLRELLAEKLGNRQLKGFVKQMPKVSKVEAEAEAKAELEAIARQQTNRKTHLNQMSLDEINEFILDPIFRVQLTPQLINSSYELITDEIGQIIAVKPPARE
ncbi:hypothetical protein [Myxosarcina sp. GI1]|uniref:hypothetical protein n=1 Tax=Myxosarcina sp. GI1 TaxID=1541065 RepID=UPI000563BEDF|nr:hypothetical protein [Myxosarcina sp. GI1]